MFHPLTVLGKNRHACVYCVYNWRDGISTAGTIEVSTGIYIRDFEIFRGKIILNFKKLDKAMKPFSFCEGYPPKFIIDLISVCSFPGACYC